MPVVPFIPMIAQGVGALVGGIAAKKAQKKAAERSAEEQAAQTGATTAAAGAGKTAQSLIDESRPYISQPAGYYGSLLHGNRAAMSQATAAPRAALQEQVRGAQQGITRSGIRGAARDQLTGNLARQQAGAVAGLTTGVQPMAAQNLATLGQGLQQTGAPLYGTSGNIYSNLLGQGFANRKFATEEGDKTGAAIGGMIANIGGAWPGKKAPAFDPSAGMIPPDKFS